MCFDGSLLKVETKLSDFKKKRVMFLEQARDHERAIMHGLSPEGAHSPIRPAPGGGESTGYQEFPLSPTLPSSGFSPSMGKAGKTPPYNLKYPTTSTPANSYH